MKIFTLPDGSTIKPNEQFQIGDQKYPAGYAFSDDEIKNLGIVVEDQPEPVIEPPAPVIPESATRLGLVRAWKEQGVWADIKALIASNPEVQEEWDLAIEVRRADPIVQGMIAALKLTDEQVDALLIRANELVQ